jgi:hypothetical protein
MALGSHTVAMNAIPGFFLQDVMRRSLRGAHAQDPVEPDRPARRASAPVPSTLGVARTRGSLESAPSIGPREPASIHDGADQRRAA